MMHSTSREQGDKSGQKPPSYLTMLTRCLRLWEGAGGEFWNLEILMEYFDLGFGHLKSPTPNRTRIETFHEEHWFN